MNRFVFIFVFGWGFAVVCSVYELSYGPIVEGMDSAVGILGTLHSFMVPMAYGYTNRRLRLAIADRFPFLERCIARRRRTTQVTHPSIVAVISICLT
jgi:hypothetical protein